MTTSLEIRFHARLDEITADAWNSLRPDDNPFLSHAFLSGLETTGSLRAEYGWRAHHLALYTNGQLIAAAPLYVKRNSHGEFVFDWSWASAYERVGLDYYPKLLGAIPYSPVNGARLLVGTGPQSAELRQQLIAAIVAETERLGMSSAHINFVDESDALALDSAQWISRFDWQFHWTNRPIDQGGWRDFDDFLAALSSKKRKNIRHERAQVARAGVICELRHGDELNPAEWHSLHQLYLRTFAERGNHPALTENFFRHLGVTLPRQVIAVLCKRGDEIIAMALLLRSSDTLYGRYWGSEENVPGLHFEACYYQGIEYCLQHGLTIFEPGAQGEHKIARGFLPTKTSSYHYISDPRFRAAVREALAREGEALLEYREELMAHSPYAQRCDVQRDMVEDIRGKGPAPR
jgi:predicted N-acyltransferase